MPSKIDDALQAEMHGPSEGTLPVEIEFSEEPPAAQLDALGLQHEGKRAWGTLSRQRIEFLATVPQVVAIRLSDRPAPSPAPGRAQIGAGLQNEMTMPGRETFSVTVRFRGPVQSPDDLPFLSIHLDVGTGKVTRAQVQQLAGRDDVVSINAITPSRLL